MNFVQNRMMKITRTRGKYRVSSLSSNNLHEMSIAKPEGEVKLTDPMGAYYLAAAGGTWTKSDDLVSILSSIMLITVSGILTGW